MQSYADDFSRYFKALDAIPSVPDHVIEDIAEAPADKKLKRAVKKN